jgi:hypothetical protein
MTEKEVPWTKMFAFDLPAKKKTSAGKCACGGKNCQTAKKIKCVCRCHSQFHGAANRVGMEPLDKALGFETEAPPALVPWLEVC